jgi:small-conductance mechanosensitive channel
MDTLIHSLGLSDPEKFAVVLNISIHIILILALAWILKWLANKGIRTFRTFLENHKHHEEEKRRLETLGRVFRYTANVIITAVAGMLVFSELGISITPILATAGVVGVAVGFGAQSLVKDYFSGLFLLLEDQIRNGDVIEAGGKAGLVEEVTLRYVRLRSYDGNVHFIPNGHITTVTNMTREYSFAVVDIGVAYREDIEEVFSVIREVAADIRQHEEFKDMILEDVDLAGVDNWGDSSIAIRMRIKVAPIQQWTVKREFLRRLKQAFDERGIEIPYPHLTIYAGQPKGGPAPAFQLSSQNS